MRWQPLAGVRAAACCVQGRGVRRKALSPEKSRLDFEFSWNLHGILVGFLCCMFVCFLFFQSSNDPVCSYGFSLLKSQMTAPLAVGSDHAFLSTCTFSICWEGTCWPALWLCLLPHIHWPSGAVQVLHCAVSVLSLEEVPVGSACVFAVLRRDGPWKRGWVRAVGVASAVLQVDVQVDVTESWGPGWSCAPGVTGPA